MGITRPFKRTVRMLADGSYSNGGGARYIKKPGFANTPVGFIRSAQIIYEDYREITTFVEPSDANIDTYSHRIYQLLARACMEVEANCRAILEENAYPSRQNDTWTMKDYRKIEQSHFISRYKVRDPQWTGTHAECAPFESFAAPKASLPWYRAYNHAKHARHSSFQEASMYNLSNAIRGLVVLMAAQFRDETFDGRPDTLVLASGQSGFESASVGHFLVRYPQDVSEDERYDFTISDIERQDFDFARYAYK